MIMQQLKERQMGSPSPPPAVPSLSLHKTFSLLAGTAGIRWPSLFLLSSSHAAWAYFPFPMLSTSPS